MSTEVKWGIMGCAGIAQKFCVSASEASNAKVVACASRDKAKAEAFIAEHCPGAKAFGSYEELLEDAEVQAVYIPLPTGIRAAWVMKAAAKKKHILIEKPIAGNTKETLQITEACQAAGVQLMDNTMFMHSPRLEVLRKVLDDAEGFGKPTLVNSAFSIACGSEEWMSTNVRVKKALEPLGALGDLGWYCVRFSLWVYNFDAPEAVSCHFIEETSEGVPIKVLGTLKFSGGRMATFDCCFNHSWRQWAEVTSEKAHVRVEDFVIPAKLDATELTVLESKISDKALTLAEREIKKEVVTGKAQHTLAVEKMSSIVASGELEDKWPKYARQTQLLLMALVSSARQQGAWVVPKEPTAKGKGKGKGGQQEIKKTKPSFQQVSSIEPAQKGLNLKVKVVSVEEPSGTTCTAVVGDTSGVVTFSAKGDEQMALFKQGASLVLRNASVRMVRMAGGKSGFIHLQVDKWGKVETAEEELSFEPNGSKNISTVEYELVED